MLVWVDTFGPLHIRELTPKDLYYAQVLRNAQKSMSPLVYRVILNKDCLDTIPAKSFRKAVNWIVDNVFSESIYTIEHWMELAFHLCKQRWDDSIDWLEKQPMSKIKLMIDINNKFAEQEKDAMKKARRSR